jgi:mono/diheme cytochrome c family protein
MTRLPVFLFILASFLMENSAMAVDPATLFASKCAVCHGQKGEGTMVAPALKGNTFIASRKPDDIKKVIMEGRTGQDKKYPSIMADMPKGLVAEAEADSLVKYLQGDLQK